MSPETFEFIQTYTHASSEWLGEYLDASPRYVVTLSTTEVDPDIGRIISKKMYEFYGVFQNIVLKNCDLFKELRRKNKSAELIIPVANSPEVLKNFTDDRNLSQYIGGIEVDYTLFNGIQYATKATLLMLHGLDTTLVKYDSAAFKSLGSVNTRCHSNPSEGLNEAEYHEQYLDLKEEFGE